MNSTKRYRLVNIRLQHFWGIVAVLLCTAALSGTAGEQQQKSSGTDDVRIHEEFENLDDWEALTFDKIDRHSTYEIAEADGERVLKAESKNSASALVYKHTFNVRKYPVVSWRWKIQRVYEEGDAKTKEGDDYPMRLYIIFEYNPAEAGWIRKAKYATAKKMHGEYPPDSTLNYIWANREHDKQILTNAYTDRAKLVILQTGNERAGQWVTERINIREDYRKAFGENPPEKASIAIMNDSDNTGASSVSWIDDIRVFGEENDESSN